jgi:hypothetical protein
MKHGCRGHFGEQRAWRTEIYPPGVHVRTEFGNTLGNAFLRQALESSRAKAHCSDIQPRTFFQDVGSFQRDSGDAQGVSKRRHPVHTPVTYTCSLVYSPMGPLLLTKSRCCRCTKPDKREFIKISQAVGMGFVIMGVIGWVPKRRHMSNAWLIRGTTATSSS